MLMKEAIKELIFENIKHIVIEEVQIELLEKQMKETNDGQIKSAILRDLAGKESLIAQLYEHQKILKRKLGGDKS
jgi:hypothetical protein